MKLWLVSLSLLINGCSVYSVSKAPEPVEYQKLVIGTPRHVVIDSLGSPTYSKVKNEVTTDTFKFIDGHHAGYKSRALLYLAGDIASGGLAEIIFWPMEEYWFQGVENKATVQYDNEDNIKKISVFSSKDEAVLYETP